MNKTLLGGLTSLILLLSIYPALALVGGETLSYDFEKCEHLSVNITPCEDGEWTVENCTEESTGNFYCDCDGNYTLNLTPAINSVGTFTITTTKYGEEEQEVIIYTPGGGWFPLVGACVPEGSHCLKSAECCDKLFCVNNKCVLEENMTGKPGNEVFAEEENFTTEELQEETPETPTGFFLLSPTDWLLGTIVGIIAAAIIIFLLRRKPENIVLQPKALL